MRSHRPHGPAYHARPLSFEEVKVHRNLGCGLYGICLQVVVRRQWPSFTCLPCSLWQGRTAAPDKPGRILDISGAARR